MTVPEPKPRQRPTTTPAPTPQKGLGVDFSEACLGTGDRTCVCGLLSQGLHPPPAAGTTEISPSPLCAHTALCTLASPRLSSPLAHLPWGPCAPRSHPGKETSPPDSAQEAQSLPVLASLEKTQAQLGVPQKPCMC